MSRKFLVLLVFLVIVFSLLAGFISGRLFMRNIANAEEVERSKILTVGGINIVDKSGKLLVKLGKQAHEGNYGLYIYGQKGSISIDTTLEGVPIISIYEGLSYALITGRMISLQNENNERAELRVFENEGANISVHGRNFGGVKMYVNEYGGNLAVYSNFSSRANAIVGVNEYGYGSINLWDKYGYRLR